MHRPSEITYVVCPWKKDFLRWCAENNIRPNDPKFFHINTPMLLLGRQLYETNKIHFVNILDFEPEVYEEIMKEIEIRQKVKRIT